MDRSQDWLLQARGELQAAQHLLGGAHWAWCCFTSQQAAGKALKAVLEKVRAPHVGHNLNELRAAVEPRVAVPRTVGEACARLNGLYIPTRYPAAFPSGVPLEQYTESDARDAIADAEEVIRIVESVV